MDDYFLDMGFPFEPTSAGSDFVNDEGIHFLVAEVSNENRPSVARRQCLFIGSFCQEMHIVPVGLLPGVENVTEIHDLDLFRWVPFYSPVTIIDPEENIFTVRVDQGRVSYSFYYAPQRLARKQGVANRCIATLLGSPCVSWYGNMLVVKIIHEDTPVVADIEDSDINMIQNLLSCYLKDGFGFNIN